MDHDAKSDRPEEKTVAADAKQISRGANKIISDRAADETLRIIEEHGKDVGELKPDFEKTLKRKIYVHVLLLVIIIDLMLYVSGYLSTLGMYYVADLDVADQPFACRSIKQPCLTLHCWAYTKRLVLMIQIITT